MILIYFIFIYILILGILLKYSKWDTFENNSQNYYVSVEDNGEWGYPFLKKIIPKVLSNKNVVFKQVAEPDLIVKSIFGKRDDVIKKRNKYITIIGEAYSEYDRGILNFTTLLPKYKNEIWFPHICWHITSERIITLKQKKFKQINERDNFLIYLACNCVPERDLFFKLIDKKHTGCHAGGKCCNNINLGDKFGRDSFKNNSVIFNNYKFVLCMENEYTPGYITEKILNAYLGGSIPIYKGDTETVNKFFNPKSFINIDNYKNFEECIDYIIDLSNDPKRMYDIQQMNIFKDGKVPEEFLYNEKDSKFVKDTVDKINALGIDF